ncbi:MAG: lysophospholipid acyltransferase family protein [Candidatus Zipacnadales bacterium]
MTGTPAPVLIEKEIPRTKHPLRRGFERLAVRMITALVWPLPCLLSMQACRKLGNLAGAVLYLLTPHRQRLADRNLMAAFGDDLSPRDRKQIRLAVCRNVCKVFLELFKASTLTRTQLCQAVPLEGTKRLHDALRRGHGVMIITAHLGNWELLGARIAAEGFHAAAVARDASDVGVASVINRARESTGLKVIGKKDIKKMTQHLRQNGMLGILPDQHARKASIRLEFLGQPAWCIRSPALLALRTGCALLPAFCLRAPDESLCCYVLEEIRVDDLVDREEAIVGITRRINAIIEQQIRLHPDQWLWLHNRWKPAAEEHQAKWLAEQQRHNDDHTTRGT